jgi:signal transduction histidine kinase
VKGSATWRLAAGVALAVTLLSVAGMALQYRLVAGRLMAGAEAALAADLAGLAALYDQRRVIALRQAIDYRKAAGDPAMLMLLDRTGTLLAGTHEVWPAALPTQGDGLPQAARVFAEGGARWIGDASLLPGGFPLMVAHPLAAVDSTLAALRRGMALVTALMLAVGAGVGWIAARRVLSRIDRVNALADRVAAGDLSARLPGPAAADEFGRLETRVHAMLDRIEALNRGTQRLSGAIAHELRTPLNRLAQRIAASGAGEAVTEPLLAEVRGAVRVFDALLDIARTEADRGAGGLLPVDLSALAEALADLYSAPAEEAGMTLVAEIEPSCRVFGDQTLLSQMISNLLDNALKYCRAGDRIRLTLAAGPQGVMLGVADTGPGLPPAIRDEVFEPFVRGSDAGHGLGLSLVRAIALRHGARLTADSASGLTVRLVFPPAPEDAAGTGGASNPVPNSGPLT